MGKLKGKDLIVFFEEGNIWKTWKTLAYATTCEIDIQAEVIETGSPDTGKWTNKKKRRISWTITCGHLLSDIIQEVNVFQHLLNDSPVKVILSSVESHNSPINPLFYSLDGRFSMEGKAYVTRMTITGRNGDFCTLSMTLAGTGELQQKYADWILSTGAWQMKGVWIDWENWNF